MTREILWTYWKFLRTFRNGHAMIRALRGGPPVDTAILRDGTRLTHPKGKDGMTTVLLDLWIYRGFLRDNFYEPKDGDVVIDCGAHIGLFSVLIARTNPRCRVLAIEPNDEVYGYLLENIRSARLSNVEPHRLGVGRTRGHGRIDDQAGERTIDRVMREASEGGAGVVPIITLPDLLDLAGVDRVAFLKVDIEGSENDLFHDADPGVVDRFDKIALEYHDNLRPGTLELLRRVLEPTHEFSIYPDACHTCGTLLARRRAPVGAKVLAAAGSPS